MRRITGTLTDGDCGSKGVWYVCAEHSTTSLPRSSSEGCRSVPVASREGGRARWPSWRAADVQRTGGDTGAEGRVLHFQGRTFTRGRLFLRTPWLLHNSYRPSRKAAIENVKIAILIVARSDEDLLTERLRGKRKTERGKDGTTLEGILTFRGKSKGRGKRKSQSAATVDHGTHPDLSTYRG